MYINYLELQSFRNYHSLKTTFSAQVNIFYGQNAQGKTNLLEAIALLSYGRSFRTKKEEELIQWGKDACYLQAKFELEEYPFQVEIGISPKEKRLKLDGQPAKNSEIFGKIPIITFAPDDLQLIKGGPQFRRDFIDLYLALIEPKYRFIYYNYYKVLQQRNRLLKAGVHNPNELEVWNEQLIEKGSKVIKYRLQFIEDVKSFIADAQYQISGTHELLTLEYLGFKGSVLKGMPEEEIQIRFREELQQVKNNELERGITLIGPNRDDLRLTIGDAIDLRIYGSQGQQRTAALALKLGLIDKIKNIRGQYPILLLDDVMSEFDDQRKQQLLKVLLASAQTFLTSTSKSDFPIINEEAYFYEVAEGAMNRVQ
ncbi:MAG TPA: DNA replication/repair protein RecF [Firmicutes bacterium]|nr:DNA replication/repair protein RecF [Bacillota bacterium]